METFDLYQSSVTLARMREFLSTPGAKGPTCIYLSQADLPGYSHFPIRPPSELREFLRKGLDVSRSLWDSHALIAHLDIEYSNLDFPAEPYLDLDRSFRLQQPVAHACERILAGFGISPLHLITGRGHHFIWSIGKDTETYRKLVDIGTIQQKKEKKSQLLQTESEMGEIASSFLGLGMVLEHVAYCMKKESVEQCDVPVELTEVHVGPIEKGRELVSIDISEYGDPLYTRMIRLPFSLYRKTYEKGHHDQEQLRGRIPDLYTIPLHEMDITTATGVMQSAEAVLELASRVTTQIPDKTFGTGFLIEDYLDSSTKNFHDWFYERHQHPPERWAETYDCMSYGTLPTCVCTILQNPNDLLLKPAGIQLITRSFLALGWHPRHIAGLIRSKYERGEKWGDRWGFYNPALRADFYTRVFTGLFVTGQDELIDYNCLCTKEKGICPNPEEICTLDSYRDSLLERRRSERLGCRPFNRLLLSQEHL